MNSSSLDANSSLRSKSKPKPFNPFTKISPSAVNPPGNTKQHKHKPFHFPVRKKTKSSTTKETNKTVIGNEYETKRKLFTFFPDEIDAKIGIDNNVFNNNNNDNIILPEFELKGCYTTFDENQTMNYEEWTKLQRNNIHVHIPPLQKVSLKKTIKINVNKKGTPFTSRDSSLNKNKYKLSNESNNRHKHNNNNTVHNNTFVKKKTAVSSFEMFTSNAKKCSAMSPKYSNNKHKSELKQSAVNNSDWCYNNNNTSNSGMMSINSNCNSNNVQSCKTEVNVHNPFASDCKGKRNVFVNSTIMSYMKILFGDNLEDFDENGMLILLLLLLLC